ncbi:MAG: type VI secretion system baseplate subunit TssG [bacterium]
MEPQQAREAQEAKIAGRIHEFDPVSLLHLLEFLGYRAEEIVFRSHVSLSSQPSLIQGIEFQTEPIRQVIISMNLGLSSAQSPLPSYFSKYMDSGMIDASAFIDFIEYFDHCLILDYLSNLYPEINTRLFSNWELTKRRYLLMLDFKSCATLHWLFQLVFPELGVKVEKVMLQRVLQISSVRLGVTVLGSDAVLGREKGVAVHGRQITLVSEGEFTDSGEPWPREIEKRLDDTLFPLLRMMSIDLEIVLVIRAQKRWARLHAESYLGYDKIQGGQANYRQIRIFRGALREAQISNP